MDFLNVSSQAQTPEAVRRVPDAEAPKGKPWFFWINYNDPHHPWDADARQGRPGQDQVLPPHLPDLPGVRDDLARYCGEIERADRSFGEAMSILRKHAAKRRTRWWSSWATTAWRFRMAKVAVRSRLERAADRALARHASSRAVNDRR